MVELKNHADTRFFRNALRSVELQTFCEFSGFSGWFLSSRKISVTNLRICGTISIRKGNCFNRFQIHFVIYVYESECVIMQNYTLMTDSAADLSDQMLERLGVITIPLNCFMKDDPAVPVTLRGKAFYDALRNGKVACTSAANLSIFREIFSSILSSGKDILYITLSSALSCMFATARIAAEELAEEFPERKIQIVDSRCASLGQGLLVYQTALMMEQGVSLDALTAYAEETKLHSIHWFTVDDLMFLKRGGRLGTVSAIAGSLLGIKPVLHVNNEGKLIPREKMRGRKNAILSLAKHYGAECTDYNAAVFIGHADSLEQANQLRDMLLSQYGAKQVTIGEIGAVIGAHAGPGTLAIFFIGTSRE